MNRRGIFTISALTALGLAFLSGGAVSQQISLKDQIIGTWALVSNDNVAPDGTKRQIFGANPKGILIFEANGRYAQIFVPLAVPTSKPTTDCKARQRKLKRHTRGPSFTLVLGRLPRRTKPSSYTRRALFTQTRRGPRGTALSST
jgi:hypothetical protein